MNKCMFFNSWLRGLGIYKREKKLYLISDAWKWINIYLSCNLLYKCINNLSINFADMLQFI